MGLSQVGWVEQVERRSSEGVARESHRLHHLLPCEECLAQQQWGVGSDKDGPWLLFRLK